MKLKEYNNILLVTHGGVYRAISWYIDGIPEDGNISNDIGNCEIKEFSI